MVLPFCFAISELFGTRTGAGFCEAKAILGASSPQNRVNAPENPQAGDFRERSHSSFTNCLLCNKHSFNRACSFDCFAKQAGFCQLVPFDCRTAVKDRFAISLLARLCCLKSTQTLGENSCFPHNLEISTPADFVIFVVRKSQKRKENGLCPFSSPLALAIAFCTASP